MNGDYVGIALGDLGGQGRCQSRNPSGTQCNLFAGHDEGPDATPHEADGAGGGLPPACPDCGGPMAEFQVNAPNEEMAKRIIIAYYATMMLPLEVLEACAEKKAHLHVAQGPDCIHKDGVDD